MRAAAAQTGPASRPERLHASVQQIRVIEGQRSGRSALVFFAVLLAVLIVSAVSSIFLHTRMAQTAYEIRSQQIILNELDAEAWSMQVRIEEVSSPSSLETQARAQGMVPAGKTGFITLNTGVVEGGTPAAR